jgi:pimeloyl-ACP methyl ester carboxylesterase
MAERCSPDGEDIPADPRAERLHEFRARHDGPVSVIGWSLGGIFGRQLGRRHPDVIRRVITLASPIRLKDHAHSNARRAYELLEQLHTETIQLPLEAGQDQPVRTAATAGLPPLLIRRISSGRRLARHVLRRHSRSDILRVDCRPRRVRDADARFG